MSKHFELDHPEVVEAKRRTVMKFLCLNQLSPQKFPHIFDTIENSDFQNDHEFVDYALRGLKETLPNPLFGISGVPCHPLDRNSIEGTEGERKSNQKAEIAREKGNNCYKIFDFGRAASSYSMSIAYAVPGTKEMALAYGNRSAVLFHVKYFKECLEDIDRALENNYPGRLKNKLLSRQENAKKLLVTNSLWHGPLPKIKSKNPNWPVASNSIKIEKNQEFGRHIVATKDINPGQVLLVEPSYAQSILFSNARFFHCSECFELCMNLIPCDKCSAVMYCSKACKRKSFVDYHRYECVVLRHFGFDIINWTALRMTLKGVKEKGSEDPKGLYKELSKLTSGQREQLKTVFFAQHAAAAKVFYVLKNQTDIFSEFEVENKENKLKSMLFRDQLIEEFNGITAVLGALGENISIGRAIYPTFSLFNHACHENVMPFFYGSTVVVKAKKKIKSGEQCFINYGVNPIELTLEERQKFTEERYHFSCKCQACTQNWPRIEILDFVETIICEELMRMTTEVSLPLKIPKLKRDAMLKRAFQIAQELEDRAPSTIYNLVLKIMRAILADGNSLDDVLQKRIVEYFVRNVFI